MISELFDGPADGARFHSLWRTDRVVFSLEDGRHALYVRFEPGKYRFKCRVRVLEPEKLSPTLLREE